MGTETLSDKAQFVQDEFDTLRVLAGAVDDKLRFFIVEKSLWGGYAELINSFALDIQSLLHVMNDYIWRLEHAQMEVVNCILSNDIVCDMPCGGEKDGKIN